MSPRAHRPPELPGGGLIAGHTMVFQEQPLDFTIAAAKAAEAHGDVACWRVGPYRWWLLNRPDLIWSVLVTEASKFHKPKLVKRLWRHFLGWGLLSLEDDEWKRHHRMVRPAFMKERIEAYAKTMVAYTNDMVAQWLSQPPAPGEMMEEMTALTLRIVAQTLFAADVQGEAKRVGECMIVISDRLVEHINMPLPIPKWWPSKGNRAKHQAIVDMERVVLDVIADRRRTGEDHGDLLSSLVMARDESGGGLTDRELRDEAMTLFFAGHETTALALTWMWYLLAKHPEVTARMRAEIDAVAGPDPIARPLDASDLPSLPYVDQVVKESMRRMTSVWSFMRAPAREPWPIPGTPYVIPTGDIIFISPYVTQNDARWFPDPERFDPDRFAPGAESKIPKGAYIPFAAGPRMCLGKNFAMMEARLVLATMVRHVDPTVPEGYEPELLPQLALRAANGVPFSVVPRTPPTVDA